LDVQVSIPHRFYVRGRGLDSEWQGEVSATGTAAEPIVNGQLNLKRGNFDLLGKPLELTKGVVRLEPNASKEIEAIIDILATYTGSDFSASVQLDGVANNPTLTLSSAPELPRDEILSRLLFGKNAGALTAVEGVQLASAIATLSGGGGGGFDPVRAIRQAAGVDVLQVDVAAEGGPTVEAGKYITKDVYVGVRQGAQAGEGAVVVEVELFDNVTVESESKQDGSQKLGARLKWDY
jgi:translocation and assembly module TamB